MAVSTELAGSPVNLRGTPRGVQAYRNAHLWLIIPFAITILGFTPGYFLKFTQANWGQHIHDLSAMLWFLLVIVQPYLATHGRLRFHRRIGIVGLLLAGMVVASGLAVIPDNIENAHGAQINPFVPPTFLYGISFFDFIAILGFGFSVAMSVLNIRNFAEHAIWMISTVSWALMPGLARLLVMPAAMTVGLESITFTDLAFVAAAPVLAVLLLLMVQFGRPHPALVLAFAGNASVYLIRIVGDSPAWRGFADAVFR